jgi:hypothetical protein
MPPELKALLGACAREEVLAHVRGYLSTTEATLRKEWPTWQCQLQRCCERRSALEYFKALLGSVGRAELAQSLDCGALDRQIEEYPKPGESVTPPHVPVEHVWWRWR